MRVPVVKEILKANDQVAAGNRERFDRAGLTALNIMASPGAGKTSLILATSERLRPIRSAVIEGDVAGSLDAERIAAFGIPVVQVNTGGGCHLEASMVRAALPHLSLDGVEVLFIENVGNLICPAAYRLGEHLAIAVGSVPEGDDKPYKYPAVFARADAVVLNKDDLTDVFAFDHEGYERGVRMMNPAVPIFRVSCHTGQGLDAWIAWLAARLPAAVPAGAG